MADRLVRISTVILAILLFYSIATIWIPDRWSISVWHAGAFALALGWAVWMIIRPYRIYGSVLLIPLLGTALWGLFQLLVGASVSRWETWNAALQWSANLVLFFLTLQICADSDIRRRFLKALLYFGFVLSVVAVAQFFTSNGKLFWLFRAEYPDMFGPFANRDHYASFVELLVPLALLEALRDRRRWLFYAGITSGMLASVIAGASRAGSFLVALEIAIVLWIARYRGLVTGRNLGKILASFAIFAAVFIPVVGWENLWGRFQQPDPFGSRREMLYSSLAMLRDRPWTGFGLGNFEAAYPAYALYDSGAGVNHAHNDWAEWAAEGGLPFLLMVAAVAVWTARYAIPSIWAIGVVTVFVHSFVDFPMQKPGLAAWVFSALGALAASSRHGEP